MKNASSAISVSPNGTIEYQLDSAAVVRSPTPTLNSDTWTLVDTETDGLWDPIFVIEIAAQRFQGLMPVGAPFRVFINHGIEIPEAATAVHGYTTDFIKANGIDPKEAYAAFREYVGDSYIAAHYLIFDWDRVLVPELTRLRESPIGKRGFCTWFLSRRSLPEFRTHKLDYLRDVFTLNCSGAHTAKGDVEAVTDLLSRVVFPRLSRVGITDIIAIADFSRLTPLSVCRERIRGSEIGVTYNEIPYEPSPLSPYQQFAKQRREEEKEQQRLHEMAENILRNITSYPKLLLDYRMLEDTPDILFRGETFVFTGTMEWGSRSKAEKEIVTRGGTMYKTRSMAEIDYLVLGEHPETGWLSRDSGTKLANAFIYKFTHPNCRLKLIRERDFIAAL
jgi:DNA polymerase III epsilon subunit-like protein